MEEKIVNASIEEIKTLTDFVMEKMEAYLVPMKMQFQISIVIDEIFNNIVSYAYPNGKGKVKLSIDIDKNKKMFKLIFTDNGIPFNPLEQNDPDVTLQAEERKIGGLGIFMVKKLMDKVSYVSENEQNILTLEKAWNYKEKNN